MDDLYRLHRAVERHARQRADRRRVELSALVEGALGVTLAPWQRQILDVDQWLPGRLANAGRRP